MRPGQHPPRESRFRSPAARHSISRRGRQRICQRPSTLLPLESACMLVVDKAFAYITSRRGLLVFTHADFPDAGVQVPAGTIRQGERPDLAAVREVFEETG